MDTFRIKEGFGIKLTKKSTAAVQLLINSNVLIPHAAKRVTAPIASSVGRSKVPTVLSKSHRNLP